MITIDTLVNIVIVILVISMLLLVITVGVSVWTFFDIRQKKIFARSIMNQIRENLTTEKLDRLRLAIRRKFQGQFYKTPHVSEPDDLLQEAIEDILSGKTEWQPNVSLADCLFKIVETKVIYRKNEKESIHRIRPK